jgi:hypothetical protein
MVVNGPKKRVIQFFYKKTNLLEWDSSKFRWNDSTLFINFTIKLGMELKYVLT